MQQTILLAQYLELVQGDDYKLADGRAVQLKGIGVCWAPTTTAAKLLIRDGACWVLEIDGTFADQTAAAPAVASFDLPRATTLTLQSGIRRYDFEVRGLLPSGSVTTLARGLLTVLAGSL